MALKIIDHPDIFKNIRGELLGHSEWHEVTQKEINTLVQQRLSVDTY